MHEVDGNVRVFLFPLGLFHVRGACVVSKCPGCFPSTRDSRRNLVVLFLDFTFSLDYIEIEVGGDRVYFLIAKHL